MTRWMNTYELKYTTVNSGERYAVLMVDTDVMIEDRWGEVEERRQLTLYVHEGTGMVLTNIEQFEAQILRLSLTEGASA